MSNYDKEFLAFMILCLLIIAFGYAGAWVVSLALAV